MGIIVKRAELTLARGLGLPDPLESFQFYKIEKKFDDQGIERNIPVEIECITLSELEAEKGRLLILISEIGEKIDAINALIKKKP